MTNDELLRLADRVEALTGPDREVDVDIHGALGNLVDRGCPADWHSEEETPAYTASLDAAMQLVPEAEAGYSAVFWRLGNDGEGGNPADYKAEILVCAMLASERFQVSAATPALALTAAALRARGSTDHG